MKEKYDKLILQIIKQYQLARVTKFNNVKIHRGRSHSVSSVVEDLFAKFLAENIACDDIFIDQPVSIDGVGNTSYPDLLIIKDNMVLGTCDLKMDMGWNRNGIFELCEKSFTLIKKMRGKKCTFKNGMDKKVLSFKVSNNCFHNIIIISDQNNNKCNLDKQINKSFKFSPSVDIFVLTSEKYLNSYNIESRKLLKSVTVNYNQFDKLLNKFEKSK